jgi:hypothetical protein
MPLSRAQTTSLGASPMTRQSAATNTLQCTRRQFRPVDVLATIGSVTEDVAQTGRAELVMGDPLDVAGDQGQRVVGVGLQAVDELDHAGQCIDRVGPNIAEHVPFQLRSIAVPTGLRNVGLDAQGLCQVMNDRAIRSSAERVSDERRGGIGAVDRCEGLGDNTATDPVAYLNERLIDVEE